jgi:hypothetical protein
VPSHDPEIRGTDAKNISLLFSQTKSIIQIKEPIKKDNLKWAW